MCRTAVRGALTNSAMSFLHLCRPLDTLYLLLVTHPASDLGHVDNATDTVASLHVAESRVDIVELPVVRDKLVDPERALHVVCGKEGRQIEWRNPMKVCYTPSTMPGSSVRPLTPPKAEPFHVRPVTCERMH